MLISMSCLIYGWEVVGGGSPPPPQPLEPIFLNVYGAQESIPRNEFRHLCSLAGRYNNPIPTWFLAPIDCLKIPALLCGEGVRGE